MKETLESDNLDWEKPLPVEGWFLVMPSNRLLKKQVRAFELPGMPVVIFRGEDGTVRAVQANCPHMGAHMQHGTVIGNAIRCPLHHWQWEVGPAGSRCLPGIPTHEDGSGIWICNAREAPAFPVATEADETELRYRHGKAVFLRSPWQAIMANAFDLNHFETVHERAMHDAPLIEDHGDRLDFHYTSRVVGHALADRVMRAISGDRIQVSIKLWRGTVFTVRTRTQKRDTFLWLSAMPVEGGTLVKPIYAVRKNSLLAPLRLIIAGWLFDAFLKKDVAILDRIQFAPKVTEKEDRYLWTYLHFVERLARQLMMREARDGK